MLSKLIKYDFRSGWKRFWPIWLGILAMTVLSVPMMHAAGSMEGWGFLRRLFSTLPFFALFILFAMMTVIPLVYVCRQFSTDLLGDPGYLTFTLPAKTWQIIASKAITALILEVLCVLVALLSGFVFLLLLSGDEVASLFQEAHRVLHMFKVPGSAWIILAETVLLGFVLFLCFDLRVYASVSIGHLAKKNRTLFSVLAYIGIGAVLNAVRTFLLRFSASHDSTLIHISTSSWEDFFAVFDSIALVLGIVLLAKLLLCGIYFLISHFILNRHLNLE